MQCVSCRFENMPGVRACGRCGSPLELKPLACPGLAEARLGLGAHYLQRLWIELADWIDAAVAG